jgi:hypothetical protein
MQPNTLTRRKYNGKIYVKNFRRKKNHVGSGSGRKEGSGALFLAS